MEEEEREKPPPRRKVPLKLVRNVKRTDSKTVVVGGGGGRSSGGNSNGESFPSLLAEVRQTAANKMRIPLPSLRLFNARGDELSEANQEYANAQITKGATLYVSAGESCVMDKVLDTKKKTEDDDDDVPPEAVSVGFAAAAESAEVVVLAKESFVETQALDQLKWAAALPHVILAVGLPDLHVGASCPIGAAIATRGFVYPTLVGSDIGCGMMLAKTSLKTSAGTKARTVDRWAANLNLEGPWHGDRAGALAGAGIAATPFDVDSLGTVGRGNHFAELQMVESIEDAELARKWGVTSEDLYLCVHSGSRGLGESILKRHTERFGSEGLPVDTKEGRDYLTAHDQACKWAQVNRSIIATRLLEQLNASTTDVLLDITHNSVEEVQTSDGGSDQRSSVWLHRKGAAPSDKGPVVIPGSRGAFSYLVQPVAMEEGGDGDNLLHPHPLTKSGRSLAHGAGRALSRTAARVGGKARHPHSSDLTATALGSRVVCEDKALLYEERPEAYKDAACVVADLVAADVCSAVALLRPVLTYKMRTKYSG